MRSLNLVGVDGILTAILYTQKMYNIRIILKFSLFRGMNFSVILTNKQAKAAYENKSNSASFDSKLIKCS